MKTATEPRTLLKDPPILVFDEATSALDSKAERAIQTELFEIASNHTALVLTMKLSGAPLLRVRLEAFVKFLVS